MSVKEAGDKISIVSAVSEDGELFFAIKYESMRDLDIITFLEQLLFEIRGFICVFWDNITIHHGENVKEFPFDHNDRMITRRIPAYSPRIQSGRMDMERTEVPGASKFLSRQQGGVVA